MLKLLIACALSVSCGEPSPVVVTPMLPALEASRNDHLANMAAFGCDEWHRLFWCNSRKFHLTMQRRYL